MLSFPNCKINLGLYVTSKREDGYHNIETVFYPLSAKDRAGNLTDTQLCDVLEIVPGEATALHTSGLPVAGNEANNLVMKAYHLLQAKFPETVTPLDIYLHKLIPMGAGLGGGSADGAFMLSLLNEYFRLQLGKQDLAALALQLGSDCPFFIYNTPQFATGRGEVMTPVGLDLSGYNIQVICPGVHVSTAHAFSMITPRPAQYALRLLPALPVEHWKEHITNDFEQPVFEQHPDLAEIKQQLYDRGALYAAMSGSGSALFGIFPLGR